MDFVLVSSQSSLTATLSQLLSIPPTFYFYPSPSLPNCSADLAVILAVDFVLDRLRTAVNVLSDAFGCIIVDHLASGKGGGGGGGVGAGGNGVLHNSSSRGGGSSGGGGGLLRSSSSGPDPEGDFVAGVGEGRGGGGAGLLPGRRPPGGYVQLQEVHSTV